MGARDTSLQGKVGVGEKGALARKKYRAQRPLASVVVAMVYPFAGRAVEPGGPALMGKGRVLRGVRTALWKRSRPRRPGRSTVTVKPWASSIRALMGRAAWR